jgi:transcriptional regulator of nitric oxide reductase
MLVQMTPAKNKPQMGRPSTGRSEYLEVKLTPEEKELVIKGAADRGLCMSDYIRQIIRDATAIKKTR